MLLVVICLVVPGSGRIRPFSEGANKCAGNEGRIGIIRMEISSSSHSPFVVLLLRRLAATEIQWDAMCGRNLVEVMVARIRLVAFRDTAPLRAVRSFYHSSFYHCVEIHHFRIGFGFCGTIVCRFRKNRAREVVFAVITETSSFERNEKV